MPTTPDHVHETIARLANRVTEAGRRDRGWRRCVAAIAITLLVGSAPVVATPGVSDEDVTAFVRRYETAVNRRAVRTINAFMNTDALVQRSCRDIEAPPQVLRGFGDGVRQGFDWGHALVTGMGEDGHYRLLRVHRVDGQPRAILRLVNAEGGLNYHDLILAERGGNLEIVDVHIFLSGELMSETVRRSLQQVVAAMKGGDRTYLRAIGLLKQLSELAQTGRHADALAVYTQMPESMQREKAVMILRITCASQVGEQALDRACRDFRRWFPDEPCVDLLTVDQLIMRQQWDASIEAFERIRLAVGDDAYLDDLIANVHRQRGDLDRARLYARRSIAKEPELDEGYWTLLELAIEAKRHEETAELLTALEQRFGWSFEGLDQVGAYAAFVRSPAYEQWMTSRRVSQVEGLD